MTDWDSRFLDAARFFASWSKDPSTKVGAVIVNSKRCIIGTGYNGFPRGVLDHDNRLADRHAEVNAILNAVASVEGATIYCTHFPCQDCAKFTIQAGIARVVAPLGDLAGWEDSQKIARTMFAEAGVEA